MIFVPIGTGDISSIWYRTFVRWYMPAAYGGNGYYIILAQQVYHTACRISYRASDISLSSQSYNRSQSKLPVAAYRSFTHTFSQVPPSPRWGTFNDTRSCRNGWYIFDMISHFRAMIYACGIWRNGYYIMLAQQVYHTAWPYITSRSDISLASKSYHRSPTSCHWQLSWSIDVTFSASCCIGSLLQLFESIFWRTKKDAARWAASRRDSDWR